MQRIYLSMAINIAIVCLTLYTCWWTYHIFERGKTVRQKKVMFRYYTYNSNILSAAASLVILLYELVRLSNGAAALPEWAVLLRLVAATSVAVTFLTVLVFLAPAMGFKEMYTKDSFYMHLVGPVLAAVQFVFVENSFSIRFPLSLLGGSTVIIYAVIYLIKVVKIGEANGGWPDFYLFNQNGRWPISFTAMTAAGAIISLALSLAHNRFI